MLLEEYLRESPKADIDARIIEGFLNDEDQAEIGKAVGLSHQQVRDRVRTIRAIFGVKAASVLGVGALAVLLLLRSPDVPSYPRYYSHDEVTLKDATPQQLAGDLRERARPLCQKEEWLDCLVLLDAARTLDPEGDRALAIQGARDRAAAGLQDMHEYDAKPGLGPRRKAPKPAPKAPEQH
jgi:hypothetical protein